MSIAASGRDDPMVTDVPFNAQKIERPDPALMRYYVLTSLLAGPLMPVVLLPLFCKYVTLRYRFDEDGIAMQWGVLFRREVYLTYRRIQDIHVTRNVVQRWMGLASIGIQTASASATPEMTIEGILEADALRDFLYQRMRDARGTTRREAAASPGIDARDHSRDEVLMLLGEIRDLVVARCGTKETPS